MCVWSHQSPSDKQSIAEAFVLGNVDSCVRSTRTWGHLRFHLSIGVSNWIFTAPEIVWHMLSQVVVPDGFICLATFEAPSWSFVGACKPREVLFSRLARRRIQPLHCNENPLDLSLYTTEYQGTRLVKQDANFSRAACR